MRVEKDAGESAIQPGTDRSITFNGKPTVTIARGADVLSDPVAFTVAALEQLAISLLPNAGVRKPFVQTPEAQAKRKEVNTWIRSSGAFDAVVDFSKLMGDPARPEHLAPAYDSGDHLHPNDAGFQAMAAAIDLRVCRETVE